MPLLTQVDRLEYISSSKWVGDPSLLLLSAARLLLTVRGGDEINVLQTSHQKVKQAHLKLGFHIKTTGCEFEIMPAWTETVRDYLTDCHVLVHDS